MGGTLFKKSSFVLMLASCSERHLGSCSEGHLLRILFERTLFEDCVWKDKLHYVRKDTFQKVMKDVL